MTTQSISTQATEFLASSKSSKSSSEKQSGIGSSFSNVMDNSLKSQEKAVHTKGSKIENRTSNDLQKKQSVEEPADYTPLHRKAQSVDSDSKSADKVKDDIANADLQSKLDKVSETIENTVKSTLDISQEEFDEIMATLGFTMLDLLNVDNLKQLVLHVNDSNDITAVLTDENLANQLQNLLQKIEELQLDQSFLLTDEELAILMKNYQREDASVDSKSIGLENLSQGLELNESEFAGTLVQESSESVGKFTETMDKTDAESVYSHEKEISLEVHKLTESDMKNSTMDQGKSGEKDTDIEMPTQLESFMNNLTALGKNDVLNFTDTIANARQMHEITNQIVEQIKVLIKPDMTSMELQLNPEHLGKISLSLNEKDGVITAQFTTQTQIAKEAIEGQLQFLRDNLNNQGLKVESIEVAIAEYNFDQSNQAASEESNQNHPQGRHNFKNDAELFTTQSDNESSPSEHMELSGSQIDYTA